MDAPSVSPWMVIGQIAGPFGVRGEIKVNPYSDEPTRFRNLQSVFLGQEYREFAVEHARPHKNQFVIKLEGVDSPQAVQALGRPDVSIPRSQAMDLPPGHYFLEDMLGAVVMTAQGESLGEVTDILRTGANDVFVIGHGVNAILIPATAEAVTELDVPNKRLVVADWVLAPPA